MFVCRFTQCMNEVETEVTQVSQSVEHKQPCLEQENSSEA